MGKKRNKKGMKKVVQESHPLEDTPLGNDAKQRRIHVLVMWYLLVTDRLRHIFLNPKEATLMTWWNDEHKVDDDKIAHPTDCSQWQRIDEKHKEFSDDLRNVRFGLSTDGMTLQWEDERPQHLASDLDHVQHPNIVVSEEKVSSLHYSYFWP